MTLIVNLGTTMESDKDKLTKLTKLKLGGNYSLWSEQLTLYFTSRGLENHVLLGNEIAPENENDTQGPTKKAADCKRILLSCLDDDLAGMLPEKKVVYASR